LETIETIYPRLKRGAPGPQGIKDLSIFLINHRHKGNSHSCYLNFWQVTISLSSIIIQLIDVHRPAWNGLYKAGGICATLYVLFALFVPFFMFIDNTELSYMVLGSEILNLITENGIGW